MKIRYTKDDMRQAAELDAMNGVQRAVKRLADVSLAFVGLVVVAPVAFVITLRLKLQGGGSVFFRQERIGRCGRPFMIIKFRTMADDAEADGPKLASDCVSAAQTGFQRNLRRWHLDELPQLWNVLCGDMSVVGPRPERAFFIEKIMDEDARYALLFRLRPGLTSEATLSNGYTDTLQKMLLRLELDLNYLRTRSLRTDAGIIMRTLINIISRKEF